MFKVSDTQLWENIKKSVTVLTNSKRREGLPPRLRVRRSRAPELSSSLDLHHLTVEEAYQKTKIFIEWHFRHGTKKILIITGKGQDGQGIIHSEFMGWLDTKILQQYVREAMWTNDNGAVILWLRKNK